MFPLCLARAMPPSLANLAGQMAGATEASQLSRVNKIHRPVDPLPETPFPHGRRQTVQGVRRLRFRGGRGDPLTKAASAPACAFIGKGTVAGRGGRGATGLEPVPLSVPLLGRQFEITGFAGQLLVRFTPNVKKDPKTALPRSLEIVSPVRFRVLPPLSDAREPCHCRYPTDPGKRPGEDRR